MPLKQWPQHILNKRKPRFHVLADHQYHFANSRLLFSAEPHPAHNPIPHFREVTVVILCLNQQRFERSRRLDAEGPHARAPTES